MRTKLKHGILISILFLVSLILLPCFQAEAASAKVKLNKTSAMLYMDGTKTVKLKATVTGSNKKVAWSSSNKKVATVSSSGKVTAKKAGTATITAKVAGKTAKCKITVKEVSVTIKLDKTSLTLDVGKTAKLKATVTGSSAKVTWSSSDKKVATVNVSGKVTAKKAGIATIVVKSGGKKATCKVIVKDNTVIDGYDVTVIGDSITVHAEDEVGQGAYTKKLPGVDIHAECGKHFKSTGGFGTKKSGLTILKELIDKNKLRDILVLALGSNDSWKSSLPGVKAGINELLKMTTGVKKIVLVTVYYKGVRKDINKLFYDAASKDSRIVIADWAGFVKDNPSKYLKDDMLHLNGREAYEAYIDLIIQAIASDES